jgi:hypothetical protein
MILEVPIDALIQIK